MPDTTTSPGRRVLRDLNESTNELGTGAPRRISPGETAVAGSARVNGRANGGVARGERTEPRWRDIQWVDFSDEPDGSRPTAPHAESHLAPTITIVEPVKVTEVTPPLGNPLYRFAAAAPAISLTKTTAAIPGLATRFTRLPVPRRIPSTSHLPQGPGPIRLRPPTAPFAGATPQVEPTRTDHGPPFPASISTPVSAAPAPGISKRRGWRPVVAAGIAATGAAGHCASAFARGAARTSLARVRAAVPRRTRQEPSQADVSAAKPVVRHAIFDTVDRVSRFVAAHKSRLRVSCAAALVILLAAVGAYVGGALIVHVAEPNGSPSPAAANAPPSNAVAKQPTIVDKASHPGAPAATSDEASANEPPSDPAARAAFYIARAKMGDAAAQYNVGVLYAQGLGLVQDYASAATWFRAAAAQGNVAAEYDLGVLYAQGLGVAANQTEAINWYHSASAQDHPAAEFNLALAYATGSGTSQDFAAAARWYQKAAAQGLAPAMVNLAILYEAGNGVDRSPVDAYAWYNAAGERGEDAAKARAGELFQQFNDRDKARAEGLAATIGAALDSVKPQAPPA